MKHEMQAIKIAALGAEGRLAAEWTWRDVADQPDVSSTTYTRDGQGSTVPFSNPGRQARKTTHKTHEHAMDTANGSRQRRQNVDTGRQEEFP